MDAYNIAGMDSRGLREIDVDEIRRDVDRTIGTLNECAANLNDFMRGLKRQRPVLYMIEGGKK